jgi:hypothetical protein
MRTFDLQEAAAFLRMNAETLRQKAKAGLIPGAKPAKCWVFFEADLVIYLRSQYAKPRQAVRVATKEVPVCHSTAEQKSGGLISTPPADNEYASLLGLTTAKPRKSSTTG